MCVLKVFRQSTKCIDMSQCYIIVTASDHKTVEVLLSNRVAKEKIENYWYSSLY